MSIQPLTDIATMAQKQTISQGIITKTLGEEFNWGEFIQFT